MLIVFSTLAVVECVCSDAAVHRSRLERRDRGLAPFPEPTWADVQQIARDWVPWELERLVVDAIDDLEANLAAVRAWVAGARRTARGTTKRPKEPPSP